MAATKRKREVVELDLADFPYGSKPMVFEPEFEAWYQGKVIAAEEDRVLVTFPGWYNQYDEWLPKTSERFDHATGGRKKWSAVKGVKGAWNRIGLNEPNLAQEKPVVYKKKQQPKRSRPVEDSQIGSEGAGEQPQLQAGPEQDAGLPADASDSADLAPLVTTAHDVPLCAPLSIEDFFLERPSNGSSLTSPRLVDALKNGNHSPFEQEGQTADPGSLGAHEETSPENLVHHDGDVDDTSDPAMFKIVSTTALQLPSRLSCSAPYIHPHENSCLETATLVDQPPAADAVLDQWKTGVGDALLDTISWPTDAAGLQTNGCATLQEQLQPLHSSSVRHGDNIGDTEVSGYLAEDDDKDRIDDIDVAGANHAHGMEVPTLQTVMEKQPTSTGTAHDRMMEGTALSEHQEHVTSLGDGAAGASRPEVDGDSFGPHSTAGKSGSSNVVEVGVHVAAVPGSDNGSSTPGAPPSSEITSDMGKQQLDGGSSQLQQPSSSLGERAGGALDSLAALASWEVAEQGRSRSMDGTKARHRAALPEREASEWPSMEGSQALEAEVVDGLVALKTSAPKLRQHSQALAEAVMETELRMAGDDWTPQPVRSLGQKRRTSLLQPPELAWGGHRKRSQPHQRGRNGPLPRPSSRSHLTGEGRAVADARGEDHLHGSGHRQRSLAQPAALHPATSDQPLEHGDAHGPSGQQGNGEEETDYWGRSEREERPPSATLPRGPRRPSSGPLEQRGGRLPAEQALAICRQKLRSKVAENAEMHNLCQALHQRYTEAEADAAEQRRSNKKLRRIVEDIGKQQEQVELECTSLRESVASLREAKARQDRQIKRLHRTCHTYRQQLEEMQVQAEEARHPHPGEQPPAPPSPQASQPAPDTTKPPPPPPSQQEGWLSTEGTGEQPQEQHAGTGGVAAAAVAVPGTALGVEPSTGTAAAPIIIEAEDEAEAKGASTLEILRQREQKTSDNNKQLRAVLKRVQRQLKLLEREQPQLYRQFIVTYLPENLMNLNYDNEAGPEPQPDSAPGSAELQLRIGPLRQQVDTLKAQQASPDPQDQEAAKESGAMPWKVRVPSTRSEEEYATYSLDSHAYVELPKGTLLSVPKSTRVDEPSVPLLTPMKQAGGGGGGGEGAPGPSSAPSPGSAEEVAMRSAALLQAIRRLGEKQPSNTVSVHSGPSGPPQQGQVEQGHGHRPAGVGNGNGASSRVQSPSAAPALPGAGVPGGIAMVQLHRNSPLAQLLHGGQVGRPSNSIQGGWQGQAQLVGHGASPVAVLQGQVVMVPADLKMAGAPGATAGDMKKASDVAGLAFNPGGIAALRRDGVRVTVNGIPVPIPARPGAPLPVHSSATPPSDGPRTGPDSPAVAGQHAQQPQALQGLKPSQILAAAQRRSSDGPGLQQLHTQRPAASIPIHPNPAAASEPWQTFSRQPSVGTLRGLPAQQGLSQGLMGQQQMARGTPPISIAESTRERAELLARQMEAVRGSTMTLPTQHQAAPAARPPGAAAGAAVSYVPPGTPPTVRRPPVICGSAGDGVGAAAGSAGASVVARVLSAISGNDASAARQAQHSGNGGAAVQQPPNSGGAAPAPQHPAAAAGSAPALSHSPTIGVKAGAPQHPSSGGGAPAPQPPTSGGGVTALHAPTSGGSAPAPHAPTSGGGGTSPTSPNQWGGCTSPTTVPT